MKQNNRFLTSWKFLVPFVTGVLFCVLAAVAAFTGLLSETGPTPEQVSFTNDVRPILNKKCVGCHKNVNPKGGFSLVFKEGAFKKLSNGKRPVVPGKPKKSEVIRRITHSDPEKRMPPKGKKPLTEQQIQKIWTWIDSGAEWGKHWSYRKPDQKTLPDVSEPSWPNNGIDHFVMARLDQKGYTPSERADWRTLLRRVSLDVVGLPPNPEEVDRFMDDPSYERYKKFVDRKLDSENFGEKWATMWLDLARFADTKGYEADRHRKGIWKYRDWVIKAFNRDLPFDRFTIEQLAGDLLPDAGKQQKIATAFHRNTMTNTEGGTKDEEFRVSAVFDRVNTTMEIWQGTTMQCVQCHSHPYDPIKFKEFYEFYAFFNNTRDRDLDNETPSIPGLRPDYPKYPVLEDSKKQEKALEIRKKIRELRREMDRRMKKPENKKILKKWVKKARKQLNNDRDRGPIVRAISPKSPLESIINMEREERSSYEQWQLNRHYAMNAKKFADLRNKMNSLKNDLKKLDPVMVPVLEKVPDRRKRETYVFERGNWLTEGKRVRPDVPDVLPDFPEDAPKNRLGLARWLVSKENPLTARVIVNRFWEKIFGRGIVKTVDDFGSRGHAPTHPKLLDWLALQFINEHDWSMKDLIKQIVTSATYMQSSSIREKMQGVDKNNKLLARGPRFRLSAEQVRDQSLAVAGLLSEKMYGPSVMPPQPEGIWNSPYERKSWDTSKGEDRYRRALYTYWKRTAPYPSMTIFDRPSRENSTGRRIRTNTPLQPLVTQNDPVYVEAARGFAQRMVEESDGTVEDAINRGFKIALLRTPDPENDRTLFNLYEKAVKTYRANPTMAEKLRSVGQLQKMTFDGKGPARKKKSAPVSGDERIDTGAEMAALTLVASDLMNLDEFLTKE